MQSKYKQKECEWCVKKLKYSKGCIVLPDSPIQISTILGLSPPSYLLPGENSKSWSEQIRLKGESHRRELYNLASAGNMIGVSRNIENMIFNKMNVTKNEHGQMEEMEENILKWIESNWSKYFFLRFAFVLSKYFEAS